MDLSPDEVAKVTLESPLGSRMNELIIERSTLREKLAQVEAERDCYREALEQAKMQFFSEQLGAEMHDDGRDQHWENCQSRIDEVLAQFPREGK